MKTFVAILIKVFKAVVLRRITLVCESIPYEFRDISYKKILNWLRTELSVKLGLLAPLGWPIQLQVEPTNACNLRCTLCPTSQMKRPKAVMDFALYKKILDEIGDYIFLILFWNLGEPFLNSDIFKMISYAKDKGIKSVSSTNGHLLVQPGFCDEVIKSGLDTLIVAVDGITQESYEKYRRGGDLARVLEGIRILAQRKINLTSATPLVNFRFMVMRHNEHEVSAMKGLAESLGADAVTFKTINPYATNTYGDNRIGQEEGEGFFLPRNLHYRRFKYASDANTPLRRNRNSCKSLWYAATIHADGMVCPCFNDYDAKFSLGDLKAEPLKGIWRNNAYQRFRHLLRAQNKKHYLCYECSYAYSCSDDVIADAVFFCDRKAREH